MMYMFIFDSNLCKKLFVLGIFKFMTFYNIFAFYYNMVFLFSKQKELSKLIIFSYSFFYFLINMDYSFWFLIIESNFNFSLFYLSLLLFFLVMMIDYDWVTYFLSFLLLILSFLFFFIWDFLWMFMVLELSSLPVIMMVLMYGSQIEKVSSIYYLLFLSFFLGIPFILFIFWFDFLIFDFSLIYSFFYMSFFSSFLLCLLFLIKFPIYFLHYWLPKMHVEASTICSMLLAGLLLKFGTMGFSRLFLFFKGQEVSLYIISFLSLVLVSFICLYQSDVKSLVAYSSIVHMGFIFFIFLFFSLYCKKSSLILMVSHGFVSVIFFYYVGEFYLFMMTRLIYFFKGFFFFNYVFIIFGVFIVFFNSSIPISLGFFSELMGLLVMLEGYYFFIIFLFFYFYFGFYFNLFFLVNLFFGKSSKILFFFVLNFIFFFIYFNINFFFLAFLS